MLVVPKQRRSSKSSSDEGRGASMGRGIPAKGEITASVFATVPAKAADGALEAVVTKTAAVTETKELVVASLESPSKVVPVSIPVAPSASPAPAGVAPPKRARSSSNASTGGGRTSFDGAKNFIAQLQKSEAEAAMKTKASEVAPAPATASIGADAPAVVDSKKKKVNLAMAPALAPPAPGEANGVALDEFEEDAVNALSGLCNASEEESAGCVGDPPLSDATTVRKKSSAAHTAAAAPAAAAAAAKVPRQRRSKNATDAHGDDGAKNAGNKANVVTEAAARGQPATTSARGGSRGGGGGGTTRTATTTTTTTNKAGCGGGGGGAGAGAGVGAAGPSASRKAADHRRLLKSYMKALFRHLNLAVDYKMSEAATYRDRINSALAFWFGDSFSPGKSTQECNAPKIMAMIVYLATSGRVSLTQGEVHEILQKGLQAKNANYTVNETALEKHKISAGELRGLFEGHSRVQGGFPRGLPLQLPRPENLPRPTTPPQGDGGVPRTDPSLPSPISSKPATVGGEDEECLRADAGVEASRVGEGSAAVVVKGARSKRGGHIGNGGGNGGGGDDDGKGDPGCATPAAEPKARPTSRGGVGGGADGKAAAAGKEENAAAVTKGAKGSKPGRTAKANKAAAAVPLDVAAANTASRGSPVFSPIGNVTAAFAAAALMPQPEDRCAAVEWFVEDTIRPMLLEVASHPVEVQLEMLNCAQGEFTRFATLLARAQHTAAMQRPGPDDVAGPGAIGSSAAGVGKGKTGAGAGGAKTKKAGSTSKAEKAKVVTSAKNGVKRKRSDDNETKKASVKDVQMATTTTKMAATAAATAAAGTV